MNYLYPISLLILCLLLPGFAGAEKIAIQISVNGYADERIFETNTSCDADSATVYFYEGGFDRVISIQDSMATKQNIFNQLSKVGTFCPAKASVFVFIAGQGLWINGQDYFLPFDANLDRKASFISIKNLAEWVESIGAVHNLMVTDIGRPSMSGGISFDANHNTTTKAYKLTEQEPVNINLIRAAGVNQFAQELPNGSGVLTYYLLKVLKDHKFQRFTDLNNDGNISISELFEFLKEHTEKYIFLRSDNKEKQLPTLSLKEDNKDFVFMPVRNSENKSLIDFKALYEAYDYNNSVESTSLLPNQRIVHHDTKPVREMIDVNKNTKPGELPDLGIDDRYWAVFDIGKWFESKKQYAVLFTHNEETYWSERLAWELLNDPHFESYFGEEGRIQLFYYNTEISISEMQEETVDTYYFKGESASLDYEYLKRHLMKGAIASPGIIVLERDRSFITEVTYLPGYKKTDTINLILDWVNN